MSSTCHSCVLWVDTGWSSSNTSMSGILAWSLSSYVHLILDRALRYFGAWHIDILLGSYWASLSRSRYYRALLVNHTILNIWHLLILQTLLYEWQVVRIVIISTCCICWNFLIAFQLVWLLYYVLSVFHHNILLVLMSMRFISRIRPFLRSHTSILDLGHLLLVHLWSLLTIRHIIQIDFINIRLIAFFVSSWIVLIL